MSCARSRGIASTRRVTTGCSTWATTKWWALLVREPSLGSRPPPCPLSGPQRADWEKEFRAGMALEDSGQWSAALSAYERALGIDSSFAELAYRRAHCQLELGAAPAALRNYERARDLDTLRFRADTRIN